MTPTPNTPLSTLLSPPSTLIRPDPSDLTCKPQNLCYSLPLLASTLQDEGTLKGEGQGEGEKEEGGGEGGEGGREKGGI